MVFMKDIPNFAGVKQDVVPPKLDSPFEAVTWSGHQESLSNAAKIHQESHKNPGSSG